MKMRKTDTCGHKEGIGFKCTEGLGSGGMVEVAFGLIQ